MKIKNFNQEVRCLRKQIVLNTNTLIHKTRIQLIFPKCTYMKFKITFFNNNNFNYT